MIAHSRLVTVALAVALCSMALAAAPSHAATYDVSFCVENAPGEPVIISPEPMDTMRSSAFCGQPHTDGVPPNLFQGNGGAQGNIVGATGWTLTAPNQDIRIASLTMDVTLGGNWQTVVKWALTASNGEVLGHYDGNVSGNNPPPAPFHHTYVLPVAGGGAVNSTLSCPNVTCMPAGIAATFLNPTVTMEDDNPPTLSGVAGLQPGATVSGTQEVSFSAEDPGSGVATTTVVIDDADFIVVPDRNGGRCNPDLGYHFLAPCKHVESNVRFPINTKLLADGAHRFQVKATDAAGQPTTSSVVTMTTANAPTSMTPPTIQGPPKLGGQLTATNGTWTGNPTAFAYQWLRCPASVTSAAEAAKCVTIEGQTNQQYAVTNADVYQRVAVRVTATGDAVTRGVSASAPVGPVPDANGRTTPPGGGNTGGGGNGGAGGGNGGSGGGGSVDRTPPVLTAVSLTHTRFRVAKRSTGRATVLSLTSSEGGQLSIAIERLRPGQRHGTVCRVVSRPVRRGRCTVVKRAGTLTRAIGAGRTSVTMSGRIGRTRLAAGSYRLVLTVRDAAGNVSKVALRPFTIVR